MSGSHINKVEVLWDCRGEVGEGPHWVAEEGALYFVDIMEKRVLRYLYADGAKAEIKLGEYTPLVAPVQGRKGQFVVGQGKKLCLLKWDGVDGGKFELEELVETDKDKPENRLNDGKVDRSGRLWAGTMPLEVNQASKQHKKKLHKKSRHKVNTNNPEEFKETTIVD